MNISKKNIITDAKSIDISKYSSESSGTYSFSIVNSTDNGKRITFSKSLLKTLDVDKTIELLISPQNKMVIVGADLKSLDESLNPYVLTLRKCGMSYKADIVHAITKVFSLDFSVHTSYTFRDIELDSESGKPVAFINVDRPIPKHSDDN